MERRIGEEAGRREEQPQTIRSSSATGGVSARRGSALWCARGLRPGGEGCLRFGESGVVQHQYDILTADEQAFRRRPRAGAVQDIFPQVRVGGNSLFQPGVGFQKIRLIIEIIRVFGAAGGIICPGQQFAARLLAGLSDIIFAAPGSVRRFAAVCNAR